MNSEAPTPRTDEVTLGEWEYGRDEDGNKHVAALDYEVLRDRSRQLERELAEKVRNEQAYERVIGPCSYQEVADELKSLRAFKQGVDEALNTGNGSYKP